MQEVTRTLSLNTSNFLVVETLSGESKEENYLFD